MLGAYRAVLAALPLLLAACDSLPWLGSNEGPPLPGNRRPVLLASDGLAADPRIGTLTVSLPPPTSLAAWPQPGGSPTHAAGHVAGTGGLQRAWSASIGAGSSSGSPLLSSPVVAEGKLFAVDADGDVAAIALGGGERLWSRSLHERSPDRLAGGGIAYDAGQLFVALSHGEVVALSAGAGDELWRVNLRTPLRAAPTIAGGRVLVRSADNQLLALNAASGDIAWRHAGIFEPAGILGGSAPAVANGVVVVAYSSGEVFGLLLESGRQLWSDTVLRPRRVLALDTISDITASPVIDGDRVYVAGAGGEMAAFDLGRGTRLWEVDLTSLDTPWTAGEFIYVVSERGELVCMLRQGGRIRWVTRIASALPEDEDVTGTIWSGPILVGNRLIVVGTNGDALAFSPSTGELLDRQPLGDGSRLGPIVADGAVYVLTDGGNVVALR